MKRKDSIRRFSKKPKKFDWLEFDEAVEYFVRRFKGEDVTISTAGVLIRVMPGVGKIEYSVLRDKKGWTVWGLTSEGDEPLGTFLSYEQAAVFLERNSGELQVKTAGDPWFVPKEA